MRIRERARGLVLVSASGVMLAACAPPLLAPDEQRSQFDSYDTIRNQHAEQYIFDEMGSRVSNIRGRLSPKQ